jgi:DNA-binding transcriptional LysR family regulator
MGTALQYYRYWNRHLLVRFAAIAEEKSITAAASRLFLSQPAVSRALQRARAMFQDDLLVRSPHGFELTLRGRKILDELEGLLPRMENLVAPSMFDPASEKSHFRISGPDNVCTVVLPRLCRQYANGRYQVQFEFWPWRSGIAELVEHGQIDLVLHIDDGLLPSHFQSERLYKEDWIYAVARDTHCGDRLPLKQYLTASHIVVATYEGVQTIPDKQLAAVGVKRSSSHALRISTCVLMLMSRGRCRGFGRDRHAQFRSALEPDCAGRPRHIRALFRPSVRRSSRWRCAA